MEEKPSDPFIGEMDEKPSNCECVSDPTFSYNGVSPATGRPNHEHSVSYYRASLRNKSENKIQILLTANEYLFFI